MKAIDLLRRQTDINEPDPPEKRIKPLKFPDDVLCEEASPLLMKDYVPCFEPAIAIVDNGDRRMYWMCGPCADHNVRNRRAKLVAVKDEGEDA